MSIIAKVAEATGATHTEILRVATQGGTTAEDWRIAHAIEAAGGRSAYELMLTAGRDERIAEVWGDAGAPAETPTQINPNATYDPEITVYSEDTAPDSPNRISPHHPHDQGEDDELAARADQAATVHADLVDLTDEVDTAEQVYRKWASRIDAVHQAARRTVQQLLLSHPRTRRRAVHRARQARRLALAA
ncbi:hypothetical protein SUDANB121_05889 (plasmid) [Nocardiopsis dassonvillei]|uniref:hypothetical protein n=1 Tax=Nocardiopsis dassonvillei TaxID=2014 RepID=UPI003F579E4D